MTTNTSLALACSYRNKPRRRFTPEFKRQLVQALLQSSESLASMARAHDINDNQLSRWRREYLQGRLDHHAPHLLPVTLAAPAQPLPACGVTFELHLPKGRIVVQGMAKDDFLHDLIQAMQ